VATFLRDCGWSGVAAIEPIVSEQFADPGVPPLAAVEFVVVVHADGLIADAFECSPARGVALDARYSSRTVRTEESSHCHDLRLGGDELIGAFQLTGRSTPMCER